MIRAKKSLGQNFLTDKNILKKIIEVDIIENQKILEVGPGTGNLTTCILEHKPKKIYVVEKDTNLVLFLKKKFGDRVNIINEDILNINEKNLDSEKLIVFGNLPYNISTEILCKWILNLDSNFFWFKSLILMFQKEVADRLIANFNTKHYGRLSIIPNWKLNIKKIFDIKPDSFSPKPNIDSSLLYFSPKVDFFKIKDAKNLEIVTRVFFSQRRKMLKKPFNQLFNGNQEILNKLKIDLSLRPQNLDFDTYYKLTSEYEKLRS